MIKTIIFDLDGTLLNTIDDIGNSVNMMLEEYGFKTFTSDEYKQKVGNGFKVLIERSLPLDKQDLVDEALEKFVCYYDKHYADNSMPYDGIIELLHELVKRDIKIAINSNKRDDYTKELAKLRFKDFDFVDIIGQREGHNKKPDPEAALSIIQKTNSSLSEVLYIGDSNTDIQTGKNANIKTVGCDWGFRGKDELIKEGADYIALTPLDILNFLQ